MLGSARHLEFDIDVTPFNDTAAIAEYARRYVEHAHVHETLKDYCKQVAADLQDRSAELRVKRVIRDMQRKQRCQQ